MANAKPFKRHIYYYILNTHTLRGVLGPTAHVILLGKPYRYMLSILQSMCVKKSYRCLLLVLHAEFYYVHFKYICNT